MSGSMTREDFDAYLVPCFAPAPFIPVRAAGSRVWDQQGERVYRYGGRHRSERPGPCSPGAGSGPAGSTGETVAYRQWLYQRAGAAAGKNPRAVDLCRQGVFSATPAPKPTRRPLSWRGNMPTISLAVKKRNHRLQPRLPRPHAVHRLRWRPARNIPAIMLRCRRALPICPYNDIRGGHRGDLLAHLRGDRRADYRRRRGDPGGPGVPAGAAYPLRSPSCHSDIR